MEVYLVMKRLMITKNSVVRIQNIVMITNDELLSRNLIQFLLWQLH